MFIACTLKAISCPQFSLPELFFRSCFGKIGISLKIVGKNTELAEQEQKGNQGRVDPKKEGESRYCKFL